MSEDDTVTVWIPEKDLKNLRKPELVNNYNDIFGLVYKSHNLINFDDRNEYQKKENFWSTIMSIFLGLIFFINGARNITKHINKNRN